MKIDGNFNYKIASSLFRIYLSIHIFKKYILLFFNKDIIFDENSFVDFTPDRLFTYLQVDTQILHSNYGYILTTILCLSILFLFGIGKNITCILLYFLIEVIQRMNGYILNGGDNFMKFILIYFCFVNSFEYFSIEKYKRTNFRDFTSNLGCLLIKIHLCIIYFISAIFKFNSKLWFSGVANYYILNINRFKGSELNDVLANNYIFVTLSTYFTLFWELLFPILIWYKKNKFFFIVSGIFLHIGIYAFMMIHDFEILFITTYIFFYNDREILSVIVKTKKMYNNGKRRLLA